MATAAEAGAIEAIIVAAITKNTSTSKKLQPKTAGVFLPNPIRPCWNLLGNCWLRVDAKNGKIALSMNRTLLILDLLALTCQQSA
jgi:hypothetical protein